MARGGAYIAGEDVKWYGVLPKGHVGVCRSNTSIAYVTLSTLLYKRDSMVWMGAKGPFTKFFNSLSHHHTL
jgi:hypothetical protein